MKKQINPVMVEMARKSRGLTQVELSKMTGVSQSAISKIEDGEVYASAKVIELLANSLNYPKSFFYQDGKFVHPISVHR